MNPGMKRPSTAWWTLFSRFDKRGSFPFRAPSLAALLTLLLAVGCREETIVAAETTWEVRKINGISVEAPDRATLRVPELGKLHGTAPCNTYGGDWSGVEHDFRVLRVSTTRKACARLDAESTYLSALSRVTSAELSGQQLTLSGPGIQLEFAPYR